MSTEIVKTEQTEENKETAAETVKEEVKADLLLDNKIRSGAGWFFWIGGLSLINAIIFLAGGSVMFVAGLGISQLVAVIMKEVLNSGAANLLFPILLGFNLFVSMLFFWFGVNAGKKRNWAFVTGMIIYGLDTLLMMAVQEWMGFAFHILAIVFIFSGWRALKKQQKEQKAAAPQQAVIRTEAEA